MAEIKDFLNIIDVPKLSEYQVKLCEEDLTEKDLYKSLKAQKKIEKKEVACKMINPQVTMA